MGYLYETAKNSSLQYDYTGFWRQYNHLLFSTLRTLSCFELLHEQSSQLGIRSYKIGLSGMVSNGWIQGEAAVMLI